VPWRSPRLSDTFLVCVRAGLVELSMGGPDATLRKDFTGLGALLASHASGVGRGCWRGTFAPPAADAHCSWMCVLCVCRKRRGEERKEGKGKKEGQGVAAGSSSQQPLVRRRCTLPWMRLHALALPPCCHQLAVVAHVLFDSPC